MTEDNDILVNDDTSVVVRFAGDSGDGMQLSGSQFTLATALEGQGLTTFPDFPSEIRAPIGTTFGVSTFQIHFGSDDIPNIGDEVDLLICMNPAALKTNIADVKKGAMIIVDSGSFDDRSIEKAGYSENPLQSDDMKNYRVFEVDITANALNSANDLGYDKALGMKARNIWSLGLVFWLFARDRQPTLDWLKSKFAEKNKPAYEVNVAALNAGHTYGEVTAMQPELAYREKVRKLDAGTWRTTTGYEALSWGLVVGRYLADLPVVLCSYPITPATTMLHLMSRYNEFDVQTFQAEDEIAAIGAAIGASWGGAIGLTTSSGPGIALKTEALGLAVVTELPLVVVNVQRGGPSTGMPTKTEQSDILQAIWGRNGDAFMPVIAAASPSDAFATGIEAVKIATKYMTPVMVLTDGLIANASEPFKFPQLDSFTPFKKEYHQDAQTFKPYMRDEETLARPWAPPGLEGMAHRIGGLEREDITGNVSASPQNHQLMTDLRLKKMQAIADGYDELLFEQGDENDDILLLGWGSTWGPIKQAVRKLRGQGYKVAQLHIKNVWPLPNDLPEKLASFKKIIVPEMNTGQFINVLKSQISHDGFIPLNKVTGRPFFVKELISNVKEVAGDLS